MSNEQLTINPGLKFDYLFVKLINTCFLAQSSAMQQVLQDIQKVAKTDTTVLIEGESGTGKEVAAREFHARSRRKEQPFVAINCSNLSPQLFESEFFGHEKGAFTGAHFQKKGKLEMAHTGTIFLDEIADLPLESQAKILRVIEEKRFQRLGGTKIHRVDARIIVASNNNLLKLVTENLFREDLFYRISVITIKLPPLRQRADDIPVLVDLFLSRYAQEMNRQKPELTPAALKRLQKYQWQGNIRELRNFIERVMVLHSDKDVIDENDINLISAKQSFQFPSQLLDLPYDQEKQSLLFNFKQVYFKRTMQHYGGSVTVAARKVGINRASLHKILRELGY
jgi:transcriptional regulator with PAS, ATPase and Fis domain